MDRFIERQAPLTGITTGVPRFNEISMHIAASASSTVPGSKTTHILGCAFEWEDRNPNRPRDCQTFSKHPSTMIP